MPTYEYGCPKCGHEFEAEQRITDEPLKTCPSCRSRKLKRLISKTSFVLKGGGWYSDLYSSGGAKKPEAAESGAADAKGETKTETPSAPAAESPKPESTRPDAGGDGASRSKSKSKSESKAKQKAA